jgi:pimeloyl-ACP methyl ester carboxylesterase
MRRTTIAAVAAAAVLLLAGCGQDGDGTSAAAPSPSASLAVAGEGCPDMAGKVGAKQVRFGFGGAVNLAGMIGGNGTTGIVLSHMAEGDVCQWVLVFDELIDQGYRVLAFDAHGFGASDTGEAPYDDDVVAAAAALRKDGATKIVLMGASMGGTFSLAATPKITPPLAGVISVSGPLAYAGVSAQLEVPKISVPVLFVAQEDDGLFGDAAKQMYADAKASPDARLTVTPGAIHGVPLVSPGVDDKIHTEVAAFLAKYAPPK